MPSHPRARSARYRPAELSLQNRKPPAMEFTHNRLYARLFQAYPEVPPPPCARRARGAPLTAPGAAHPSPPPLCPRRPSALKPPPSPPPTLPPPPQVRMAPYALNLPYPSLARRFINHQLALMRRGVARDAAFKQTEAAMRQQLSALK
jgi:hypothetical protein